MRAGVEFEGGTCIGQGYRTFKETSLCVVFQKISFRRLAKLAYHFRPASKPLNTVVVAPFKSLLETWETISSGLENVHHLRRSPPLIRPTCRSQPGFWQDWRTVSTTPEPTPVGFPTAHLLVHLTSPSMTLVISTPLFFIMAPAYRIQAHGSPASPQAHCL